MQPAARSARECLERARLVDHQVVHLLRADFHRAPAEAGEVGQRRMRADRYTVLDGETYGGADRRRIAGVEAAGDVRRADERHDGGVGAHLPGAVALSHVAVQVDGLQLPYSQAMPWSAASSRARACLRSSAAVSRLQRAKWSVPPGASCASRGTSAEAISAILG